MSGFEVLVTLGALPQAIMDRPDEVSRVAARDAIEQGAAYMARTLARPEYTPRGATGKARQSIYWDWGRTLAGWPQAKVRYAEPASGYIIFPQEGTRPHWPPIEPLAYWAQRVLRLDGDEARRVGYLIARKIAMRGTKKQDFIGRAAAEQGDRARDIMQRAAMRATARWEATGR